MSVIMIKPYVDPEKDTTGLSKLGMNAFPGTSQITQVPIKNGRFLTGYDVKAAYISELPENERKKEIARIEKECKELADRYPQYNICDCSEENPFYRNMLIEISAENTIFNTNNIIDAVKLNIIKTYAKYSRAKDPIIALSLRDILDDNHEYKYYISDEEADTEAKVSKRIEINRATTTLDNLRDKDKTKLLLVIKYLLRPNKGYNSESELRRYERMDNYIAGVVEGETGKAGEDNHRNFVKVAAMSKDDLIMKVTIKYAIHQNVIRQNRDKEFIFLKTGQELGKTPEEVYNFLASTKNTEIFKDLMIEVEKEGPIF